MHVGLALAQVLVLDLRRTAASSASVCTLSAHSALHCSCSISLARPLRERRVVEDHEVHVEERRELRRRMRGHLGAQLSSSPRTVATAASKRADLLRDLVRRHEVMGDLELGVRVQVRPPDGDAAGDGDAVDGEAHGARPARRCHVSPSSPNQSAISPVTASMASRSSAPVGLDADFRAFGRRKHHHPHDALGVDALPVARQPDLARGTGRRAGSAWPRRAHAAPAC